MSFQADPTVHMVVFLYLFTYTHLWLLLAPQVPPRFHVELLPQAGRHSSYHPPLTFPSIHTRAQSYKGKFSEKLDGQSTEYAVPPAAT